MRETTPFCIHIQVGQVVWYFTHANMESSSVDLTANRSVTCRWTADEGTPYKCIQTDSNSRVAFHGIGPCYWNNSHRFMDLELIVMTRYMFV